MKKIETREELIKSYIDFFKSKAHKEIINSPLIPENDPTVLFTTAGMHPLVPFLLGQEHHLGKRLVNVQKCIRTGDIDSVGDASHLTFFEMLGNWSIGDYFKKEAIEYSFEFLTKILDIPFEMLSVSVFEGDKVVKKDEEAAKIWKSLGIKDERIAFLPKENNWWGPAGKTGPCGPDTEMFFYLGKKPKGNPKTNEKEWREIWNDVFMQYNKNEAGNYLELKQKNVDTGMGVERVLAVLNNKKSVYETSCFLPIIKKIEEISGKEYGKDEEKTRAMRIIADHIKASVFILAEKVAPSNVERGYVLRRLIRRAIRYGKLLGIEENFTKEIAQEVMKLYKDYSHIEKNKEFIFQELELEEATFEKTLKEGIKYFEKLKKEAKKVIDGKTAFLLYQSYGFPLEMTQELAKENNLEVDISEFEQEQAKHQELSRTASAGVFKAGLADNSEQTTKLHTATHLLLSALKQVLKKNIEQRGSNITAERLRFDFSFDRKLEEIELKEIEEIVNKNIKQNLEVKREEMSVKEAKSSGATGIFEHKYGDKVSVYTICNPKDVISREICCGPHVTNTKELGKFKILKEEASSKGVRRIKASLE
ncbi:alanine--tRNA ligase [Candidatus Pacearchaeota archaeon]|nr:alanine--tRNA ligase [Candidatus Pacearchaeota archaeon]